MIKTEYFDEDYNNVFINFYRNILFFCVVHMKSEYIVLIVIAIIIVYFMFCNNKEKF